MNPWISHVKQYAADNNLSYKDAMKQAKSTYQKVGGSKKSGYVRKMVAMKNLDITKVRKPSKNLKKMAELTKPNQIKVKKIKVVKKSKETNPVEMVNSNDKLKEFQQKLLVEKIPIHQLMKEALLKDAKENKKGKRK